MTGILLRSAAVAVVVFVSWFLEWKYERMKFGKLSGKGEEKEMTKNFDEKEADT